MAMPKLSLARRLFAGSLSTAVCMLGILSTSPDAEARHHRSRTPVSHTSKTTHHGRHQARHHAPVTASKTRYAYPMDFFMMHPPEFDRTPLSSEGSHRARSLFENGTADSCNPAQLVRAGVFRYHPIRGGVFRRREEVKYIIVHSTESGVPQDAEHVIEAWSSLGRRHPGAQFVVDRDGTIWEACDPDLATVHVNIFKTLPGINNDNTIGIEMCHAGSQTYTPELKTSVTRLVAYLQDRYHVLNENIITHRYAQQGDHTDPVNFDWEGFLAQEKHFHNQALAMKRDMGPATAEELAEGPELPMASVYMEMHKTLRVEDVLCRKWPTPIEKSRLSRIDQDTQTSRDKPRTTFLDTEFGVTQKSPMAGAGKRPAIRPEIEVTPDSATDGAVPSNEN